MGRQLFKMVPASAQPVLCGGCGEEIKEHPKRCSRCWYVHVCVLFGSPSGVREEQCLCGCRPSASPASLLPLAHPASRRPFLQPRGVTYHDQTCQRKHWHAGHRQQCQDVSCGGLDWAAEAAAAEAGLAAWEEGEQALTPEQRRARLGLEQLRAVIEHREGAGLPLRNGDIAGAVMGQQCPIS